MSSDCLVGIVFVPELGRMNFDAIESLLKISSINSFWTSGFLVLGWKNWDHPASHRYISNLRFWSPKKVRLPNCQVVLWAERPRLFQTFARSYCCIQVSLEWKSLELQSVFVSFESLVCKHELDWPFCCVCWYCSEASCKSHISTAFCSTRSENPQASKIWHWLDE